MFWILFSAEFDLGYVLQHRTTDGDARACLKHVRI